LVQICNQFVKNVTKIWFHRQDTGKSDLIFARGQIYPGKGPNKNFGVRKCDLGPNFWNLAPKRPPGNPAYSPIFPNNISKASTFHDRHLCIQTDVWFRM